LPAFMVALLAFLSLEPMCAQAPTRLALGKAKGGEAIPATLAPPVGLSAPALARTASTILLIWDKSPSPSVRSYEVYCDDVRVANTRRLHYTATGLAANTTYRFAVRADDGSGKLSSEGNRVETPATVRGHRGPGLPR
jgi:hypothetical protein